MPDGTASAFAASDRFFDRLPPHIHAGLTAEQRTAIAAAIGQRQGAPPSINLRFSVPVPPGRVYLAIMAGRDRRGRDRRQEDRQQNPLRTMGNTVFVIAASIVLYALIAGTLLAVSS